MPFAGVGDKKPHLLAREHARSGFSVSGIFHVIKVVAAHKNRRQIRRQICSRIFSRDERTDRNVVRSGKHRMAGCWHICFRKSQQRLLGIELGACGGFSCNTVQENTVKPLQSVCLNVKNAHIIVSETSKLINLQ